MIWALLASALVGRTRWYRRGGLAPGIGIPWYLHDSYCPYKWQWLNNCCGEKRGLRGADQGKQFLAPESWNPREFYFKNQQFAHEIAGRLVAGFRPHGPIGSFDLRDREFTRPTRVRSARLREREIPDGAYPAPMLAARAAVPAEDWDRDRPTRLSITPARPALCSSSQRPNAAGDSAGA